MSRISDNRACPGHPAEMRNGFSLIELLIVLALLGIITGAVLTHMQSTVNDQLDAAARIVASDLYYVRNLSVANNSSYRLTFEPLSSSYYFEHSGANAGLDTLPPSPHGVVADSPTRQSTNLGLGTAISTSAEVAAVRALTPSPTEVTALEFGPLGETTRSEATRIWLAAGVDDARRYVPLTINPVTGNVTIGDHTTALPVVSQDPAEPPMGETEEQAPSIPSF